MASVNVRFSSPVPATVVRPFADYKEGQKVEVDRAATRVGMVGVAGQTVFLPTTSIDEAAREEIFRRCKASA